MEKNNTKKEILLAALDLFSYQGYEATSISQIASAVGIKKASLYSHYESKKAILDALVKEVLEQYEKHSMFSRLDSFPSDIDGVIEMIKAQLTFIIHDPFVSKARKLLVIEQFKNEELAKLQTKQNYTDIVSFFVRLLNHLKNEGVIQGDDTRMMAMQLAFPINVWINLCDRESERESEVLDLVEGHLRAFFKVYKNQA
ncbi:TetR/AcrR family transcriptional regulator [Bullifex porci]|uniref:TetR/AcrR family transcriptional regulator n=1 Tax=Bullifex porci TaxID=2606638 RepID=UPI0023F3A927|nr:TetR/AcrR family transcriptional regulator [Bullifex porci]MDD7254619.1 TetR/AcrR family transcriptional regulator [Bullifex porci]MDY2741838.1 TetR/AcrR family transcriptional regulator [Bullifex porci]